MKVKSWLIYRLSINYHFSNTYHLEGYIPVLHLHNHYIEGKDYILLFYGILLATIKIGISLIV